MTELTQEQVREKCDLIYIEMPSGLHIAIDATYIEQVEHFKVKLPTGEVLNTRKLKK